MLKCFKKDHNPLSVFVFDLILCLIVVNVVFYFLISFVTAVKDDISMTNTTFKILRVETAPLTATEFVVEEQSDQEKVPVLTNEDRIASWIMSNRAIASNLTEEQARQIIFLTQRECVGSSVDYRLVIALMKVESGYFLDATSNAGAKGLMQIVPKWFQKQIDEYGITDVYDIESNIILGCGYLKELSQKTEDPKEYLAMYHGGPAATSASTTYDEQVLRVYYNLLSEVT